MKQKVLLVLLVLFLALVFSACGNGAQSGGGQPSNGNGENNGHTPDNGDNGVVAGGLRLVYSSEFTDKAILNLVADRIYDVSGERVLAFTDSSERAAREIVLGATSRPITKTASRLLSRIERNADTEASYLIYSDGGSVAVVYDEDAYSVNAAFAAAIEELLALLPECPEGNMPRGTLSSGTVNVIDYQRRLDTEALAEEWLRLGESLDPEFRDGVVEGLEAIYSLYSSEVISWFANLYDPDTGGFYYSNSARNNEGYLPDAESTRQALNFISGSGMADSFGGSYVKVIPEWMKKQIIAFIKGLQQPNGFFYHPQWGIEKTDSLLSRRGRDLNWCTKILADFGVAPTYDTPNGFEGDGISADGTPVAALSLTERLGVSACVAAGRVISVSSTASVPKHMRSEEAFRNYLAGLDVENESYEVGNELSTQSEQIIARDKQLKKENAGYSLAAIAIEWLDSHQNPETGTWDALRDYHATNGLMKISCFYNDVGARLNYADKAISSALYSMTTDEDPYNVCCMYNNWFTVNNVIENIRMTATSASEAKEEIASIRKLLYAQAEESLKATAEKLALFRKNDGSFSYKQRNSSPTSQGMPVAVPNTNEGDVNATNICIDGTVNNIYAALGLSSVKVRIFTDADRIYYLSILNGLGTIIKGEDLPAVSEPVLDFENSITEDLPDAVSWEFASTGATISIEKKETQKGVSNVLSHYTSLGGNDHLRFKVTDPEPLGEYNTVVFESDICMDFIQVTSGRAQYHIFFETNKSEPAYQARIVRDHDGTLYLRDHDGVEQGQNVAIKPRSGDWFNLRVTLAFIDKTHFKASLFVDGELIFESDKFYGVELSSDVERVRFLSMTSMETVISLDNLSLSQTNEKYAGVGGDGSSEEQELSSAVLPVKGGANGVVVLIHDDGDLTSAKLLDKVLQEYGVVADVAMIASRVYDTHSGTPNLELVAAWQALFDNGRWGLVSHSMTHKWWGEDKSALTSEIVASGEILRSLFKDKRVLTFAYPGFSAEIEELGSEAVYEPAKELIKENYIGARYWEGGAEPLSGIDWSFLSAESIGSKYLNTTLGTVDSASEGKLSVIFMHQVCPVTSEPPANTVTVSHMKAIAERIAKYTSDGRVWNTFLEDALLYLREAECASLETKRLGEKIELTLTDTLDDKVYNYPLTVRLGIKDSWSAVKVSQGERTSYSVGCLVNGEWTVDVEILPDGGVATVAPIEPHNVPHAEHKSDRERVDFEASSVGDTASGNGTDTATVTTSAQDGKFTAAVEKESDGNMLLHVTNKSTSNKHIYLDNPSLELKNGVCYVFETEIFINSRIASSYLKAASAAMMEIDFRGKDGKPYYAIGLVPVKTSDGVGREGRAISVYSRNKSGTYTSNGTLDLLAPCAIPCDEWTTLRIEFYRGTSSVYVDENGVSVPTKNGDNDTTLTVIRVNGEAVAYDRSVLNVDLVNDTTRTPERVDLKLMASLASSVYLDGMLFTRTEDTPPELPGEDEPKEEGVGINFAGSDIGDITASDELGALDLSVSTANLSAAVGEDPTDPKNKVFVISDTYSSNAHVRVDFDLAGFPEKNSSGNAFVYESKMYFSSKTPGGSAPAFGTEFMTLDFRNSSGKLLYTVLFVYTKDAEGNTTVGLKSNVKADANGNQDSSGSYVIFYNLLKCEEWFTFKMVSNCYTVGGVDYVDTCFYVNGVEVASQKGLNMPGSSGVITPESTRANLKLIGLTSSLVYLDNILFERIDTDYLPGGNGTPEGGEQPDPDTPEGGGSVNPEPSEPVEDNVIGFDGATLGSKEATSADGSVKIYDHSGTMDTGVVPDPEGSGNPVYKINDNAPSNSHVRVHFGSALESDKNLTGNRYSIKLKAYFASPSAGAAVNTEFLSVDLRTGAAQTGYSFYFVYLNDGNGYRVGLKSTQRLDENLKPVTGNTSSDGKFLNFYTGNALPCDVWVDLEILLTHYELDGVTYVDAVFLLGGTEFARQEGISKFSSSQISPDANGLNLKFTSSTSSLLYLDDISITRTEQ